MSDTTPDRGIGALAPRARRDPSSLVAKNRPAPTEPRVTATEVVTEPDAVAEATTPTPASNKPQKPRKAPQRPPRAAAPATEAGAKVKVSADVDSDVAAQARAAFRAAGYFDNVPSFSKYVEGALRRENERIAAEHNAGEPFEPLTEKLAPGRKPGS